MRLSPPWLSGAIVAIAIISFGFARPALADSYTVVDLGNANDHGLYGIDTAGDVVVWGTTGCGVSYQTCYVTYVNGVAANDSLTAPVLAYDDGTACGSTPAGFNALKSVCNNGWTGFGSLFNPNGDPGGVYLGSDSGLQLLQSGSADQLFLNSVGDFAWVDGLDERIFVAMPTPVPIFEAQSTFVEQDLDPATAPEPASLLLAGTGLLLFLAAIRRKANGQPSSYID